MLYQPLSLDPPQPSRTWDAAALTLASSAAIISEQAKLGLAML